MDKIPFSVYDFFGYLSSGVVVLFSATYSYQGTEAFDIDLGVAQILLSVVGAYVIGHVVAAMSSFLLERRLTRGVIGSPTDLLFEQEATEGWRRVFGQYHKPLPEKTAERVLSKAKKAASIESPGEALFFHCFGVVRQDEYPRQRLATFLNLYGFARNVAMAALIGAVMIGVSVFFNDRVDQALLWAGSLLTLLVSVAMYFRYLKFYRQYSVELYVTYAEM
ncbi:MAG: hypothetical protein V3S26_01725 [Acidimicrobiia bacterium]